MTVLASAGEPTGIWVRWPGGGIITAPIPRAAREMTLDFALEFIDDDELVEITPKNIRLRKRYLDENERKRMEKK